MSLKTVDVTDARVTNSHRRTHSTESSASAALTDRADEDVASESDSFSSDTLSDVSKLDICGVGRTFNRAVGLEVDPCLRTGCAIQLDADLATTQATLRANIIEQASLSECCVRLMVQGAQYWFSTNSPEHIADSLIKVATDTKDARERRRSDAREDAVPASVCILEPVEGSGGTRTLATWLFRHDVLDGWRCLRYLTSLLFARTDLTVERLRARHAAKKRPSVARRLAGMAGATAGVALLAPLAAYRLAKLTRSPEPREGLGKFYLHAHVSVSALKELGKARRLGSLTNTLTCAITAAYFAADPTTRRASVASNVLFDPDIPSGNHVCLKVASVAAPAAGADRTKRAQEALVATAGTLNAASQKLSDTVLALASRKYVLGKTPERWNPTIEARQQSLDLLISNLPAFDACTPGVPDLQVVRDYDNWAPSIVYAIGVGDAIFLDFYFGVKSSFDREAFVQTFCELGVGATNVHSRLPTSY